MDKCPFCGAERISTGGESITYKCNTWIGPTYFPNNLRRHKDCFERELAAKDELLREAVFHLKEVLKFGCHTHLTHITEVKAQDFLNRLKKLRKESE